MKMASVSLSYDDGLPCHHELVAPLLGRLGIRATFYPFIMSEIRNSPEAWKQVAAMGHELGNHSLFHPCRQSSKEPFPWLDARYDLRGYSLNNFRDELLAANFVLQLIDGKTERTYGNTCCHLTVGPEGHEIPMKPVLEELFVAARGEGKNPAHQTVIDPYNVGCVDGDGKSLQELQGFVEQAAQGNKWLIFMFHGVGEGTHDLFVEEAVHRQFAEWLSARKDLRIDTVLNIGKSLKTG